MKSKDLIKQKFRQDFVNALKSEDPEQLSGVLENLADEIQQSVMDDFEAYKQTNDSGILTARGVHQLTSAETKFYQALKQALETGDIKQAFAGLENAYPEETINSVTDGIRSEFPLLDAIDFTITPALVTKVLKNGATAAKAFWGALNTEITKELNGSIETMDVTKCKNTAYMPIPKDMIDAGLMWLDAYVRALLTEATGTSLCFAVTTGTGKDCPIGMDRDVSKNAAVVNENYPQQAPVVIDELDVATFGALFAELATDETGRSRTVSDVIMVVNPVDYYSRIIPAVSYRDLNGNYVFTLPFPVKFIEEPSLELGKAIIGIGKNYNLTAGYGGKDGVINFDDSYKLLEDLRIYLTKIHANGMPKDSKSFIYLDINALPVVSLSRDTTEISVSAIGADTSVLGKDAGDLQDNILIGNGEITGTLKYVTGYTGFSGLAAEQKGNFIALHIESANADSIKCGLLNGKNGLATLDADGDIVLQITDKARQKVKVVVTKGTKTTTRVFSLDELVLEKA